MKLILAILLLTTTSFAQTDTFTTAHYTEPQGLGLKRNPQTLERFKDEAKKFYIDLSTAVPARTDLTLRVSPPENQNPYGTCWDFSIIKALRSAFMLVGKDPGQLSFNYLICDGHTPYSCNSGGDFDAMDQCIAGKGPWLASSDPYPNCSGVCKEGPTAASALDKVVVGSGRHAPTFQELATALSQNHMLTIDVAVCGAWGSYKSGIFNRNQCSARSINHMINMVGYDCETAVDAKGNCMFNAKGGLPTGVGYLIIENNWGAGWGEKGYMRTRYGIDAVATNALYFEVTHTDR